MNWKLASRNSFRNIIIKCSSFGEIVHTHKYFRSLGFAPGFEPENYANFYWLGVNYDGLYDWSSPDEAAAIRACKLNSFDGAINIIPFNVFFNSASSTPIDDNACDKIISLLKSKKAFNEDCAHKVTDVNSVPICYHLLAQKKIGEYRGRYFLINPEDER